MGFDWFWGWFLADYSIIFVFLMGFDGVVFVVCGDFWCFFWMVIGFVMRTLQKHAKTIETPPKKKHKATALFRLEKIKRPRYKTPTNWLQ